MTSPPVKDQVQPRAYWITTQILIQQKIAAGVPHIIFPRWAKLLAYDDQSVIGE